LLSLLLLPLLPFLVLYGISGGQRVMVVVMVVAIDM
jgi:hypothetical protein